MKPLFLRLRDREYEENQILDKESILWLKRELNLKNKIEILQVSPLDKSIFLRYAPKKSWFTNPERIKTIHGISHALRVMLYSYILCKIYKIDRFEPFLVAASIHDIKRINDREDKNHGKRASEWFFKESLRIKNDFSKKEVKEICVAVEDGNSNSKMNHILRCADALDRYRLPKRKWWLKKELIPLAMPDKIINFSKHFTILTEEKILNGKESLRTVLNSAKRYNIISD